MKKLLTVPTALSVTVLAALVAGCGDDTGSSTGGGASSSATASASGSTTGAVATSTGQGGQGGEGGEGTASVTVTSGEGGFIA